MLPILLSLAFALAVGAVVTFGWTSIAALLREGPGRIRDHAARLRKLTSERLVGAMRRRKPAEQAELV